MFCDQIQWYNFNIQNNQVCICRRYVCIVNMVFTAAAMKTGISEQAGRSNRNYIMRLDASVRQEGSNMALFDKDAILDKAKSAAKQAGDAAKQAGEAAKHAGAVAKEAGKQASDDAKLKIEVTKRKNMIASENRLIDSELQKIGQIYYVQYRNGETEFVGEAGNLAREIDSHKEKIAELEKEIEELQQD